MVTIKEIAKQLGISASTVSKGLNGAADISGELRHTVINTAIEMGYTAKRIKNSRHKKLCLFLEKTNYEPAIQFSLDIVLGFQQAAACEGRDITVIPYPISHNITITYDAYMLKHGFCGAFFVCSFPKDDWSSEFTSTVIPTVFLGNCCLGNPHTCQVSTDLYGALDIGISHLKSLNHKKIAFLNDAGNPDAIWLQRAYYMESAAHRLTAPDSMYACTTPLGKDAGIYLRRFLQAGATAFMCGSDMLARAVIKECALLGLSVPQDISVIGFGSFASSALAIPPLTTIGQNWKALGRGGYYALAALFQEITVSQTLLRAELILRDSTAPCRQ